MNVNVNTNAEANVSSDPIPNSNPIPVAEQAHAQVEDISLPTIIPHAPIPRAENKDEEEVAEAEPHGISNKLHI